MEAEQVRLRASNNPSVGDVGETTRGGSLQNMERTFLTAGGGPLDFPDGAISKDPICSIGHTIQRSEDLNGLEAIWYPDPLMMGMASSPTLEMKDHPESALSAIMEMFYNLWAAPECNS